MMYRRCATPLHAAGAWAGLAYCLALGLAVLLLSHPLPLTAATTAIVAAGVAAGAGGDLRRAAVFAVPMAVTITVINALVARDGLTVILRLGDLPLLGHTDVTLEATVYGALLGLRAIALIFCATLYMVAVDPDELLRLLRQVGFRSALTATLATRLVPVLMRDARRLADAQRCRVGPAPSRLALVRATTSGMLDRALDVAAALEVRGYARARRPGRRARAWSRHDGAFAAAAAAVVAIALWASLAGADAFAAYPSVRAEVSGATVAASVGLLAAALLPFAERRGIAP